MFVNTVTVWLSIIAFITAIVNAGTTQNLFAVSPSKDPKCHIPLLHGCNSSIYPILEYKISGWFFHPPFKSCRPLYVANGKNNCTINQDLPLTKEHCEDLCAEPCTMRNGSKGICMLDEYCKLTGNNRPSAHPRPCNAYNVNCCPQGQKSPESQIITTNNVTDNGKIHHSTPYWSIILKGWPGMNFFIFNKLKLLFED